MAEASVGAQDRSAGGADGADDVLVDERDGVLVIRLNRPRVRNALTRGTAERLAAALDELDARPDISVGVLGGEGRCFCAGMDLSAFARGERASLPGRGFGGLTEAPPVKPLIAAVEGAAVGGGLELVLACDLVVAASDAVFSLPEVRRGLAAAAGGLLRLPRAIPPNIAMEMALTGEPISAQRAYDFGLVNRLALPGTAIDAAYELAKTIAANTGRSVAASKQVLAGARDRRLADEFHRQREVLAPLLESATAREGAKAFVDGRAAGRSGGQPPAAGRP
ncbi:crotonase/enoyl-CoA hydratase family protein [Streptomyces sp. H27-D2]|uniref:crotonase/enoyl-CoA hydratase family protein n=1 Tax=Streptomyces sp. H27-D2 TaxID=3046304 RepID=UPI002DB5D4F7|nr:crotonase/enoyl-CoA hydratase family protein [Streptomyces sp. H27-D2]MEC4019154.1 crotonase/enoyl-CoA hydratase family protein [Streptomyces sp. H27-D2]